MKIETNPNKTFQQRFFVCEHCDWTYLAPSEEHLHTCPNCYRATINPIYSELPEQPHPELLIPFDVSATELSNGVAQFAQRIPYPPEDFTPENLTRRLRRIYLPMWMVDAEVTAQWQAEVGYDYQVLSHQDHFDENAGGWKTREVKETRQRWEPRVGRLKRKYQNIPVPALESDKELKQKLGSFNPTSALPFSDELVEDAYIRLPDRSKDDVWPDAIPGFIKEASEEVRQAAGSDHIREFRWKPEFTKKNWTYLLLPIFSAYYLDDENKPQLIKIHGQSGRIYGMRRGSMRRAQRKVLLILGIASLIFVISTILAFAGLFFPPVVVVGGIGMVGAVFVSLGAVIPVFRVWRFNKSQ